MLYGPIGRPAPRWVNVGSNPSTATTEADIQARRMLNLGTGDRLERQPFFKLKAMLPNRDTEFLPFSKMAQYTNEEEYFCTAIVFSPETENNHFHNCPPYIHLQGVEDYETDGLYFEVPYIVAYYGKTHPCYTMQGNENNRRQGAHDFKLKLKRLFDTTNPNDNLKVTK